MLKCSVQSNLQLDCFWLLTVNKVFPVFEKNKYFDHNGFIVPFDLASKWLSITVLPRRCSCGHFQPFMASCWRSSQCGRWLALSGRRWAACPPPSTLTAPWRLSSCSALPRRWKASFTLTQVKTCLHKQMPSLCTLWYEYITKACKHTGNPARKTQIEKSLACRLWTHRKNKQRRGKQTDLYN